MQLINDCNEDYNAEIGCMGGADDDDDGRNGLLLFSRPLPRSLKVNSSRI